MVVDLVGLVERETGLHAWDAQTDEPFDGRVHDEVGLDATRRIGQEAADAAATDGMAERAEAGDVGPDTGPVEVPGAGARAVTEVDRRVPGAAATPARLRYVVIGAVVVVVALLLRSRGESSTLSGLALAVGVADIVIGVAMYRGWPRGPAGGDTPTPGTGSGTAGQAGL